jgi:prepilin-type N-terminal cleavage/methylation domain-containing protein
MKGRRGFTLIELVVSMVVLGILATLAINYQTRAIEKGRGGEARQVLLTGYAGFQRLRADNAPINAGSPLTWARMGMSDPSAVAGRYFNYSIRPNSSAPTSLRGQRNVTVTGCTSSATHRVDIDLATGRINESIS